MGPTLSWLLVLLGLLLIGLFQILKEIYSLNKKVEFCKSFLDKFVEYLKSDGEDTESYAWLINRSPKMQRYMGEIGQMSYRPAHSNYIIHNYQIVVNLIPQIRQEFNSAFPGNIGQMADTVQETIIRYAGTLEDERDTWREKLKNPIQWFSEGIGMILFLPISLLYYFKILSSVTIQKLKNSLLFNLFKFIVFILTILSALMTIILGWEEFLKFLESYFKLST